MCGTRTDIRGLNKSGCIRVFMCVVMFVRVIAKWTRGRSEDGKGEGRSTNGRMGK